MKAKPLIIGLGVLAFMIVGFLFFKLPQPVIEIAPEKLFTIGPFTVTNTIFTAWLMIAIIALVCILGTRRLSIVPRGFQNVLEAAMEAFGSIVYNAAGEKNGRRFFPVVFILFLYIVLCNWSALTPVYNHIGLTEDIQEHFAHEVAELEQEHPGGAFETTEKHHGWVMKKSGVTLVPMFADTKFIEVEIPAGTKYTDAMAVLNKELAHKLGRDTTSTDHSQATGHGATGGLLAEEEEHPIDRGPLHEDETYGFIAPFLRGVNSDINAPLAYALWSAIFVEFWGITALGLFGYGSKFFNFKRLLKGDIVNGLIDIFVGILEFISELSRIISFTFRLFGNIFAGEILLFMMSFLMPFILVDAFYALEIFVGLIQGFVFAMLTTVFGVMAVASHGDHDDHGGGHGHSKEEHHEAGAHSPAHA